jgi:hypothetical protein
VRHSIAEDARDIDGLIATLSEDCVYEIVPTGQRWWATPVRAFYEALFAAFPTTPSRCRRSSSGRRRFEVATLTGTIRGRPGRHCPALVVSLESSSSSRGIRSQNGSASGSGSTGEG